MSQHADEFDVVIVGSGFGGSINALRLAEAGKAVIVPVAEVYGGRASPLDTWKAFQRIITVHPLGGCHLSETPRSGVVAVDGEVHNYPGLYVADGSVIPSSIGFHPVMTISAVAERFAEAVVSSFAN